MAKQGLTNDQKKQLAKTLFLHENITQLEIAERVNVRPATISKWVNDGKWADLKVSISITKEEQLKNLYNQLKALNETISSREEKNYASSAEADTITKLANAISKMEGDVGVADTIAVISKFLEWLRKFDLKQAQELTPLCDGFIQEQLK